MTLLNKVKLLCDQHGETLASLERKMNFGNGTIRRWDNTIPSGDRLAKIADFFNVSVDYLLGREEPNEDYIPDENYVILSRKAKELSPEKRKQLLDIAKVMFQEEFKD